MINLSIPENATSCRACKEVAEHLKKRVENKDNFLLAVSFESGVLHVHAPVSNVQFEHLNKQFNFLT
jgi:hypothetical protein